MKVGQKIKNYREANNYTQDYMANNLKISITAYGKIERDETEMSLSRLEAIAKIFKTNYRKILDFDVEKAYNIKNDDNAAIGNNSERYNDLLLKQYQEEILHLRKENSTLLEKIIDFLNRFGK